MLLLFAAFPAYSVQGELCGTITARECTSWCASTSRGVAISCLYPCKHVVNMLRPLRCRASWSNSLSRICSSPASSLPAQAFLSESLRSVPEQKHPLVEQAAAWPCPAGPVNGQRRGERALLKLLCSRAGMCLLRLDTAEGSPRRSLKGK